MATALLTRVGRNWASKNSGSWFEQDPAAIGYPDAGDIAIDRVWSSTEGSSADSMTDT